MKMLLSISEAFQKLKQNLEITQSQTSAVSERHNGVRDVLDMKLDIEESFLTGSYKRNTMIAPLSKADIDIFFILDQKYFQERGQRWLLHLVKRNLLKTYSDSKINLAGQAVTITFADFLVDVVPAFYVNGGGYLIPNTKKLSWIHTDPKIHEKYISRENKKNDGNLIPIIKMIKGWNRIKGNMFSSFYLELLVAKVFDKTPIINTQQGLLYFFLNSIKLIKEDMRDPFEYGGTIPRFTTSQDVPSALVRNRKHFINAYDTVVQAEKLDKLGRTSRALVLWKHLFGQYFDISAR